MAKSLKERAVKPVAILTAAALLGVYFANRAGNTTTAGEALDATVARQGVAVNVGALVTKGKCIKIDLPKVVVSGAAGDYLERSTGDRRMEIMDVYPASSGKVRAEGFDLELPEAALGMAALALGVSKEGGASSVPATVCRTGGVTPEEVTLTMDFGANPAISIDDRVLVLPGPLQMATAG